MKIKNIRKSLTCGCVRLLIYKDSTCIGSVIEEYCINHSSFKDNILSVDTKNKQNGCGNNRYNNFKKKQIWKERKERSKRR